MSENDKDKDKDKGDKRDLLGLDKDQPLPRFGKRPVRPPVTDEEKRQHKLEEFRKQARSQMQEDRERDAEELNEAKTEARKVNLFRFGRSESAAARPASESELSEEEEWHRRMSRQVNSDPEED